MRRILFWLAFAMVFYDFFGHVLHMLAGIDFGKMAWWWNKYSGTYYTYFETQVEVDIHFSKFFAVVLILLLIGRK